MSDLVFLFMCYVPAFLLLELLLLELFDSCSFNILLYRALQPFGSFGGCCFHCIALLALLYFWIQLSVQDSTNFWVFYGREIMLTPVFIQAIDSLCLLRIVQVFMKWNHHAFQKKKIHHITSNKCILLRIE